MSSEFVVLGAIFQVSNRVIPRTWKGSLDSVCAQIKESGFDPAAICGSLDSEIRVFPARFSPNEESWRKYKELIAHFLASARKSVSEGGVRNTSIVGHLEQAGINEMFLFATVCAATGATLVLKAIANLDPVVFESKDQFGMTPVAWACAFGQSGVIKLAADCKACFTHTNNYSWGYADIASTNGHKHLVTELIQLGSKPTGSTVLERIKEHGIPMKGQLP